MGILAQGKWLNVFHRKPFGLWKKTHQGYLKLLEVWSRLGSQKSWHKAIWFKLALLRRLPTRDRLRSWGLNVPEKCLRCSAAVETHHHRFFECQFLASIWTFFAGSVWRPNPPQDIHSAAAWICMDRNSSSAQARCIIKLMFQSTVYLIWRERNRRIFALTSSSANSVRCAIDKQIRDSLLSLPASPRVQPSMPQFFLACTRPPWLSSPSWSLLFSSLCFFSCMGCLCLFVSL